MKRNIAVILSCVGLILLFSWLLWIVFHIQQNNLCLKSSYIFADALRKEESSQIERKIVNYSKENSKNGISGEEMMKWCDQEYLFRRDSARTLLDSLFRATLLDAGIKAETAIRCIRNTQIINTSSDSIFYVEAIPLKQIIYRIDENQDKNISLQAYIKLPFGTIWNYGYLMWMVCGMGFLLLGGIVCSYKFGMHRTSDKKLLSQQQIAQEEEKLLPGLLVQSKTIEWIKLSEDLSFDKEHGGLCYKQSSDIYLSGNLLKLFSLFISTEQYILTHENICEYVLTRSIRNGLSKSDRDAVSNTIRNLRKRLNSIPVIEIKQINGKGYQMFIQNSNLVVIQ